jgi:hypothetical protein
MYNIKVKITTLLLAVLFITACSYPDSPKVVASKFLTAFQKHDFNEAAKYGTKETGKLLKQIERIEELDKEQLPLPSGLINIVSEEIDGNKAVVFFKEQGNDGTGKEERLKLVKVKTEEGVQWKVSLSKTDLKLPEPLFGPAVPDSLPKSAF